MATHVLGAHLVSARHFPRHRYDLRIEHDLRVNLNRYLDAVDIPVVAVLQSVAGAACYAASSILQQRAARAQPAELSMRPGLLLRLLRSGRWLLGIALDVVGFILQFLALRRASLALVMPIFVVGLVMSIVGSALADRRRPQRAEWVFSILVVFGVVLFIGAAQPGPGFPRATAVEWSLLGAATIVVTSGCVALAQGTPRRRALLLGVATGIVFGVTAAVTERTGHLLNGGALHALTAWPPYALAAVGILGLLLNQSAYQAGDLRWSLPVMTVLEPITAIVIGQVLFGEHIASTPAAIFGEAVGLVAVTAGVFGLAWLTVPESATKLDGDRLPMASSASGTGAAGDC
jgi:drug/metabolite transporter (DMT)-like permease